MTDGTCCVPDCSNPKLPRNKACSMHHGRWYRTGTYEPGPRWNRTGRCSVEGCEKPPHGKLCIMHQARKQRTGTTDLTYNGTYRVTLDKSNGYLRVSIPKDHPLARGRIQSVQQHRVVLFDHIGYGPHRCTLCQRHLNWGAGLQVDHIDTIRTNNDLANLRPLCNGCNLRRAFREKKSAA